jgi:hypothetical protein
MKGSAVRIRASAFSVKKVPAYRDFVLSRKARRALHRELCALTVCQARVGLRRSGYPCKGLVLPRPRRRSSPSLSAIEVRIGEFKAGSVPAACNPHIWPPTRHGEGAPDGGGAARPRRRGRALRRARPKGGPGELEVTDRLVQPWQAAVDQCLDVEDGWRPSASRNRAASAMASSSRLIIACSEGASGVRPQ